MSLKKLFEKKSINVSGKSKNSATFDEFGSIDYIKQVEDRRKKIVLDIDYEDPSQFARYGLAEKYYTDSIEHIYKTYPYDGSFYDKEKWKNDNGDLTNYIFEKVYPKQTGYINLGFQYGSYTTVESGYRNTDKEEYIEIKGVLRESNDNNSAKDSFIYSNKLRETIYNLDVNGDNGVTVEFYLKKENLSGSEKQVIFDLWNGQNTGTDSYGRLKIEIHPGISGEQDKFYVEVSSGSYGAVDIDIGSDLDFVSQWHHYAVSFINLNSQIEIRLYVDGDLHSTKNVGTSINKLDGNITATLGALNTAASGTINTLKGWGKLSGSLDEFRYWKEKRTDKYIANNYFLHVNGGADTNNTSSTLGAYYKFNEGIVSDISLSDLDSIILDYSGKTNNASWIGYTFGSRNTGSALEISKNTKQEEKEPIVYSASKEVQYILEYYEEKGRQYDEENNSNLYGTLPSWMYDEDQETGTSTQDLLQIMSYFFDDLHNKIQFLPEIKQILYRKKTLPFMLKILEDKGFQAVDLFNNINELENFLNRSETEVYENDIQEIKNTIYQNIHSNLLYFYKSKGTEKMFRNLIHCFGVDEDLVKMNLYSDAAEFVLTERTKNSLIKQNCIDFNKQDNFGATIYQKSDGSPDSLGYIPATDEYKYLGNTTELNFIFPKKNKFSEIGYIETSFLTSSLFGMHESSTGEWASPDRASIQVFSVREDLESNNVYFQLSSSYFATNITSSLFKDVYEDTKWNLALRIKNKKYPLAGHMLDTTDADYYIELYGVNYDQDIKQHSFLLTASIDSALVQNFYSSNKMLYVGAHRQNFSGSLISGAIFGTQKTDIRAINFRHWHSYLDNESVDLHARDISKYGIDSQNYRTSIQQYLMKNHLLYGKNYIPQIETLALNWSFNDITGSTSNQFTVIDASSGSLDRTTENMLSFATKYKFTGKGEFFEDQNQKPNRTEYINHSKTALPETLSSEDMTKILEEDDEIYTREARPINYYFAIEKSMYNIISQEMISWLGSVTLFNNLIGNPKYRYEEKYKELELLKTLFFKNVQNEPDFDKFLKFYKWVDDSISTILQQFIPVSMNYSNSVSNIIESHILERNKYKHKLPTIEFAGEPPLGIAKGIGELKYKWDVGHAPISGLEKNNCYWWKNRAERKDFLNEERQGIFSALTQTLNRNLTKVYNIEAKLSGVIIRKKRETSIIIKESAFDLTGTAFTEVPDILPPNSDCDD